MTTTDAATGKGTRSRQAGEGAVWLMFALAVFLLCGNVATFLIMRNHVLAAQETAAAAVQAVPASSAPAAAEAPAVASEPAPAEQERPEFRIINGHDHLYRIDHLERYLPRARALGIEQTLFVASSEFTIMGQGSMVEGNEWNTRELLRAAAQFPGEIIPFASLHPDEPDKLEKLKAYVAEGVQGLKLYTGHSTFYDRSLDAPEMDEIYAYCAEIGLPLCWHINLTRFQNEFVPVMERYPNLKVIIPHFGVTFYRPGTAPWTELGKLLDTYPNLYVDTSFGTREILVAGLEIVSANPGIFQRFYEAYQDRIIWGTDMVVTGNRQKTPEWIESVIRACRDLHEKDSYYFWMAAEGSGYGRRGANNKFGKLRGLNLSNEILEKIYRTNLERLLATPPIPQAAG